jgi:nucleotide-binding universal stress UspA family protein
MAERKILCVADGSPECRTAVFFGALRAARTQARLVLLRVVEPLDPGLWATMGDAIRDQVRLEALDDLQELAAVATKAAGVSPELVIREGAVTTEIRALIDEDSGVKTLLLAAARGRGASGTLVGAALRGGFGFGERAVAVMVVPDGLSDTELDELAR